MDKEALESKVLVLKAAIDNRKTLIFDYEDMPRAVEPYHIGLLGQEIQLHSYQVAGESISGQTPQWRNFALERMENLQEGLLNFTLRSSYNPKNAHYQEIFYSVYDKQ